MKQDSPKRKLVAIMFIDMVGYTALMQKDESKARKLVQRHRELMKPQLDEHKGEILHFMGDGTLCTFESAIEAVNAALEMQNIFKLEDEMSLRIGIHIGDIVIEGDEVYGDGINVASRLEPLAEPDGICVSHQVYENIKNQSGLRLSSLGKKGLKNVDEEMEVFAVTRSTDPAPVMSDLHKSTSSSSKFNKKWIGIAALIAMLVLFGLKLEFGTMEVESKEDISNLSIAVLPFKNMSADPENEFFADGLTEDLLIQLSKIKSLEVISRTSIMQYKNTTKSLSEIGKELGVGSILEGSVRRGGNRVRITAQLINARTAKHLWAEMYDRELDDIFAIQIDVANKITVALKTSLTPEEEEFINEKPTNSLEAYDLFLKGRILADEALSGGGKEGLEEAIRMFQYAIELDPKFINAHSRLAKAHMTMYWDGHGAWDRTDERLAKAKRVIDKVSEIDSEHPEVHLAKGYYYYWGYRNYDEALKYLIPTLEKQPNNSDVSAAIGYVYRRKGEWDEAIAFIQKAVDLDPLSFVKTMQLRDTYSLNRMWQKAEHYTERLIHLKPKSFISYSKNLSLAYLSRGDLEESRMILNDAMRNIDPYRLISLQGGLYVIERKYEKALNVYEKDRAKWYGAKAFLHLKLGHMEKAYSYFDSMRVEEENKLKADPNNILFLSNLGFAYAGLGRKVEAIENGVLAVGHLPLFEDAYVGTFSIESLAEIYTMVGEIDKAIDQLELLLSIPSYTTVYRLKLDPKWDPLRKHPRFIQLIANS